MKYMKQMGCQIQLKSSGRVKRGAPGDAFTFPGHECPGEHPDGNGDSRARTVWWFGAHLSQAGFHIHRDSSAVTLPVHDGLLPAF